MRVKVISCVGQRALAVITPLQTLLRGDLAERSCAVVLAATRGTQGEAEKCRKWLGENFPALDVSLVMFRAEESFVKSLAESGEKVYFNANAGMNWQVAFMCLHLPSETTCLASDAEHLYTWKLLTPTEKATVRTLADVGLATYGEITGVRVRHCDRVKQSLSAAVRRVLSTRKTWGIAFDVELPPQAGTRVPERLLREINDRLVWVHERRGRLYLLFDLSRDDNHASCQLQRLGLSAPEGGRSPSTGYFKDLMRIVTAVFDPVNYTVAVISDIKTVVQRARTEGLHTMRPDVTAFSTALGGWIAGSALPRDKSIMPDIRVMNATRDERAGHLSLDSAGPFVVASVGDNVETTLKAVLSGRDCRSAVLLYDRFSPRIGFLARRIRDLLEKEYGITGCRLAPTDHLGGGVYRALEPLAGRAVINITPGTKTQTSALAAAARALGIAGFLQSIDGNTIRRLSDAEALGAVHPPTVMDAVRAQILDGAGFELEGQDLWRSILSDLGGRRIKAAGSLLGLKWTKKKKKGNPVLVCCGGSTVEYTGAQPGKYPVNPRFLDPKTGGIWWEAVVATAIRDCGAAGEVVWQLRWGWPGETVAGDRPFFTELDVVFTVGGDKAVVSCKTAKSADVDRETFLVRSEAMKRFGRFTLAFLALPYEDDGQGSLAFRRLNGAMVLTPSVLADPGQLAGAFREYARGISSYRERGDQPEGVKGIPAPVTGGAAARKVVIQKPDLDTCLTGLILGARQDDEIIVPCSDTPAAYLADPAVLCIEAGGSGQCALGNFDHHDPAEYLPPACRQAMEYRGIDDELTKRLVDYVCAVDELAAFENPPVRPTLSGIFSGMLMVVRDPASQFSAGMALLGRVRANGIDPFGPMPDLPEWQDYRAAKERQAGERDAAQADVRLFETQSGRKAGYLKTDVMGGAAGMFRRGCDVVVLFNPRYGTPPRRKFTIAGNGLAVTPALRALNRLECGWGGRETIIGSPWGGSVLAEEKVMEVVAECL